MTDEMLLNMPAVCLLTGRSRAQLYRDMRAKSFPMPVKRGRRNLWPASVVQDAIKREIETLPTMQFQTGARAGRRKAA